MLALAVAGKLGPALAESWKQPDAKTYEFTLHKDAKWHDGEPFSSKDVTWSLKQWAEGAAGAGLKSLAANMDQGEARDANSVRIVLKNADLSCRPWSLRAGGCSPTSL